MLLSCAGAKSPCVPVGAASWGAALPFQPLPCLLLQGMLQVCCPSFSSVPGHCHSSSSEPLQLPRPALCQSVPSSLLWLSHPLTVLIAFPNARLSSFSNFPCIIFEIDPIKFLPFSMSSPALKAESFVASCS